MRDIYGFLTFKIVEIIEKLMRAHTTSIFNLSDIFQAQSLIIRQEIIGNVI